MLTVIIFDHPYTASACDNVPHHRSFLAALLKATTEKCQANGEIVDLIDLHADHFNPVMTANDLTKWRQGQPINDQCADYQRRLLAADRIIFMFPIWWEAMPAMTKGFLDKVYAKDRLYTAASMQTKLVKHPKIDVITTMSTPNWAYRWLFGAPVIKMLFRGTFIKTRLFKFKWHNFAQVEKRTPAQREHLLQNIKI